MTVIVWPTTTNDDGTFTSGSIVDETYLSAIESGINTLCHSSANPTVTPVNITDEVVLGRKSRASLAALWDVEHSADGTHNLPATVATTAAVAAHTSINLLKNSTFWCWPKTLALPPAYFAVANGTVAIAGTGQADTERYVGKYCAKLTRTSSTATLTQIIIDTTDFARLNHLKVQTKKISFGMWIKSSISSHLRLQLDDGNSTTESAYHTGGGGWEFISGVHTMSSSATKVSFVMQNVQSGSGYFSGGVVAFSDIAPTLWYPEPKTRGSVTLEVAGGLATGDGKKYITFARPIRLDHIQGMVLTDPVGASINIDFEKFEPTTSWQSMGTAGALIDNGDGVGQWLLTTTATLLHDRCLAGWFGASGELSATGQENAMARLNIDQVGSGTTGSDLFLRVDGVQCVHPFESEYAYDDQGV